MPPICIESSYTHANQEGRLLLAIQALKNDAKLSVRRAARIFEVPETILRERRRGINECATICANNHKLTQLEEESLEKWIIAMDDCGTVPRHKLVREMANLLFSQYGKISPIRIGKNWVTNYIKRHPELDFCYICRRDYQYMLCNNPKFIQGWFNRIQKIICEYGIYQNNIYNFDKTDFAMDFCSTAKIVIYTGYYGRRAKIQSGNCEWITAIETINASGWAFSFFIVFKTKVYNSAWFFLQIDYFCNWYIEVSNNGWTINKIGIRWLKNYFIPLISSQTKDKWYFLILDGYGSYITGQFDQVCKKNNIIPIVILPYLFHLFQLFDIDCFSIINREYGQLVQLIMVNGLNYIDKFDFLSNYPLVYAKVYTISIIQNIFAGTGLVFFSVPRILDKLNIHIDINPPGSRTEESGSSGFIPYISQKSIDIQCQTRSIGKLLQQANQSDIDIEKILIQIEQLAKGARANIYNMLRTLHGRGRNPQMGHQEPTNP